MVIAALGFAVPATAGMIALSDDGGDETTTGCANTCALVESSARTVEGSCPAGCTCGDDCDCGDDCARPDTVSTSPCNPSGCPRGGSCTPPAGSDDAPPTHCGGSGCGH
ncbi:MAG: hypothetical protein AO394_01405 [Candidatus Fermentibacter daniensis]|nr:MAG: hypothetical protein AO394_01405 [Candidatus Fermentibacter daniensis]